MTKGWQSRHVVGVDRANCTYWSYHPRNVKRKIKNVEMPSKKTHFTGDDSTIRRKKRVKGKFDSIVDENGDD